MSRWSRQKLLTRSTLTPQRMQPGEGRQSRYEGGSFVGSS